MALSTSFTDHEINGAPARFSLGNPCRSGPLPRFG